MDKTTITPPELARRWGVANEKVMLLIKSGQLVALNLAANPHGRPRYRILLSEVERFEKARSTQPPPEVSAPRRRHMTEPAAKEYF
jgi:hypothetical protein